MGIAIFLQARLDSSRLKNKALLPLADRTVVEHCMRALLGVPAEHYVLLTDQGSEGELSPLAEANGFMVFAGHPEDVLDRFARASERFPASTVVRATGDNPLVSAEVAQRCVGLLEDEAVDYAGLTGMPLGTGTEAVRSSALAQADREARDRYSREHVTPWIYQNPDRFRIHTRPAPAEWVHPTRVTLDTPEDYRNLRKIFEQLYEGTPIGISQLVNFLRHGRERSIA